MANKIPCGKCYHSGYGTNNWLCGDNPNFCRCSATDSVRRKDSVDASCRKRNKEGWKEIPRTWPPWREGSQSPWK